MSQWTLFEKDFRSMDEVLYELLERTNALSVHLVDRSGQLVTSAGRTGDFDPVAFASLRRAYCAGSIGRYTASPGRSSASQRANR